LIDKHIVVRVLAILLVFTLTLHASANARKPGQVLVTIELAKSGSAANEASYAISFPSKDCNLCSIETDPRYVKQNAHVAVIALLIPCSTAIPVHVETLGGTIRRVLLEGQELPFELDSTGIVFTVPAQPVDRINSGEFQTHIYWPGIDLRFEHGDSERRDGSYRSGAYPFVELKAAHNLEFAQLLAIRMLGLDSQVVDHNLGSLDLMGFDTDFPHGHTDFPPHMHMILWWPTPRGTGSLIAHYYITPHGLLDHNEVIPFGTVGLVATRIEKETTYTDTDFTGQPLYTHTITKEGWLQVGEVSGSSCLIRPLGAGFDSGAAVECATFHKRTVQVEDDIQHGAITVVYDGKAKSVYTYDTDSGRLLGMESDRAR
jgi:hypothetical protein